LMRGEVGAGFGVIRAWGDDMSRGGAASRFAGYRAVFSLEAARVFMHSKGTLVQAKAEKMVQRLLTVRKSRAKERYHS